MIELPYMYKQTINTVTKASVSYSEMLSHWGSEEAFINDISTQAYGSMVDKFVEAYAEQAITIEPILPAEFHLTLLKQGDDLKVKCSMPISFYCESNLQGSPILVAVIIAIGIAVALIVAAFTIPPAFRDWLKSMTTTTSTSEKWEWVLNPDTGEYDWKLVSSETFSEPNPFGIGSIGIILILLMVVFLLFSMGMPRK